MASQNEKILSRYFRKERVLVNIPEFNKVLRSHQDYPSIHSLSESLGTINIDTMATRLDMSDLAEVDLPIIAVLNLEKRNDFVLVQKLDSDSIEYFDGDKTISEPFSEFQKKWKGVSLLIAKNENSGLSWGFSNVLLTKWLLVSLSILGLVITYGLLNRFFDNSNYAFEWLGSFLCCAGGLYISYTLFQLELGEANSLANKVCVTSENVNCEQVLSSKSGKLLNAISWSQIGLFFFGGQLIVLIYSMFIGYPITLLFSVLVLINGLALPFVVYNVYNQAVVIKEWCTLCLISNGLILVNFIYLLVVTPFILIQTEMLLVSAMSFLFTLYALQSFVSSQKNVKQQTSDKRALNSLKYDVRLFQAMLSMQPAAPKSAISDPTVMGTADSPYEITIVSSPFCAPCAKMHDRLIKLDKELSKGIRIRVIMPTLSAEDTASYKLAKHLAGLSITLNPTAFEKALESWLKVQDKFNNIEDWISRNSSNSEVDGDRLQEKLSSEKAWADEAKITATPTLFFGGYKFPDIYQIEDLEVLLK